MMRSTKGPNIKFEEDDDDDDEEDDADEEEEEEHKGARYQV